MAKLEPRLSDLSDDSFHQGQRPRLRGHREDREAPSQGSCKAPWGPRHWDFGHTRSRQPEDQTPVPLGPCDTGQVPHEQPIGSHTPCCSQQEPQDSLSSLSRASSLLLSLSFPPEPLPPRSGSDLPRNASTASWRENTPTCTEHTRKVLLF